MFELASFEDLPEFGVGHATDEAAGTGCSVFVSPNGAVCGVDVRGGGPATRETDLLDPTKMVEKVQAVCLSGGSAFGLEAASGVMEHLAAKGLGFAAGPAVVPIVPSACLFDLLLGKAKAPDKAMGDLACAAALDAVGGKIDKTQGNVGAGCGCSVGKMGLFGTAMKSGFGWFGLKSGGLIVIACVAVNALGNVVGEDGAWLAGTQGSDGSVCDPFAAMAAAFAAQAAFSGADNTSDSGGAVTNTTLGVLLTNATLNKAECTRVSQIAHDGYARAIKPVHSQNDGDAIFTMASCTKEAQPMQVDLLGFMACEAFEHAIRNAVRYAKSAYGLRGLAG